MRADLLLRGGTIVDGSGAPRRLGDVAIVNGLVEAVGDLASASAATVIELDGLAVARGFIDVHTHGGRLLLADPSMAQKVSQGVTTVVVGNCGISLAPLGGSSPVPPLNLLANEGDAQHFDSFAGYFSALQAQPSAINCAALIGHTTLRVISMADLERPAEPREIAAMQALVREGLAAGAVGVSTGTYYAPASAATSDEMRQVFEPLRGTSALIASHIRDEGERVLESMNEAIAIAQQLGVRQVLSHHKVIGRAN